MSLTNIKFYNKSSSSPTHIYFADYDGKEKVVMKVYIDFINQDNWEKNSNFFEKLRTDYNIDDISCKTAIEKYIEYSSLLDGLKYETNIYSRVIRNIIDYNYSINFVEFVDFQTYSLDVFIDMIDQTTYTHKNKLYTFIKTIKDLKAITCCVDDNITDDLYKHIISNFNVKCLITKEPTNIVTIKKLFPNLSEDELYKIIFQLIYNLTLMDIIKLQHNDLHTDNILIERLDRPIELYYIINSNKKFKIETKYVVRIFDWDLAYIYTNDYKDILSKNKIITKFETLYKSIGIRNEFIRGFDLYTLICLLDKIPVRKKYDFMNILFRDAFNSGLLKYSNFTNSVGHHCRPNISENLEKLDYVGDIIFNPIFDQFDYTSTIPYNATNVYNLPNEGEFRLR